MQRLLTPRVSKYCPHQPEPKQALALIAHRFLPEDEASEVLFGGAAGPGKSDWLLMGALEYDEVPDYAALLLRRTFQDLALPGAIMARSQQWLRPYVGQGVHWSEQRKKWTFPSGASLTFGYIARDSDVYQYQSAEFQYIGFDELTQFTEFQYTYLRSRLRRPSTGPLSLVPLRQRAASNPGGIGHGWVKKHFPIDGKPRKAFVVFIPARLEDNPHVDRDAYRKTLEHLPSTLRDQLLNGNWDAFEGMAFEQFDEAVHCVEPFEIPDAWHRFSSLDHGTTNPTCELIWAVDYDGNCIIYDSYYEKGRIVSQHAPEMKAKREQWWPRDSKGWPVHSITSYADPSIWNKTGLENKLGDPASVATEYQEHGIDGLTPANNDRKAGRLRVSELLKPDESRVFPAWHPRAGEPGCPRLFFVAKRCPELVEQVSSAPLLALDTGKQGAGEIVDPDWESMYGHAVATLRYGAMSRPSASEEVEQEPEDARERMLKRITDREREEDEEQDMYGGGTYA